MHAPNSYDYALIRLVPSVERGECLNVGVLLFCRTLCFLGARIHLDEKRALALAPDLDLAAVQDQLDTMALICKGEPAAVPLGKMSQSERFHWLVSPRSTIIQISPVHMGLCDDPEATLEQIFKAMVFL
ncbi:MAG TPA: DUF3037 domain-containing protein [Ktedonobacteraceae bacterium]